MLNHSEEGIPKRRLPEQGVAEEGVAEEGGAQEDVEEPIRALAHPGRRAMLRLVWDGERPASDLADAAGLSRSATSQHLRLLRDAGLVTVRVDGNRRLYRADLDRVAEVASFLEDFWAPPLARLKAAAERNARGRAEESA